MAAPSRGRPRLAGSVRQIRLRSSVFLLWNQRKEALGYGRSTNSEFAEFLLHRQTEDLQPGRWVLVIIFGFTCITYATYLDVVVHVVRLYPDLSSHVYSKYFSILHFANAIFTPTIVLLLQNRGARKSWCCTSTELNAYETWQTAESRTWKSI